MNETIIYNIRQKLFVRVDDLSQLRSGAIEEAVGADRRVGEVGMEALFKRRANKKLLIRLVNGSRNNGFFIVVEIAVAARNIDTLRCILISHGLVSQDGFGINISRVSFVGAILRGRIKVCRYIVLIPMLNRDFGLGIRVFRGDGQQTVFSRHGSK